MGKWKLVGGAVAAALAVVALAAAIAGLRAQAALDARDEAFARELAAYRASLSSERRPVLVGEPIAGNAVAIYLPLLREVRKTRLADELREAGAEDAREAGPWVPLPDGLRSLVDERMPTSAWAAFAGSRHERCDFELAYERGPAAELPPLIAALPIATLFLLDGHTRAADDPADAADAYLVALRFGADMAQGSFLGAAVAARLESWALAALGRLVTAGPPLDGALLEQLDGTLLRAAPLLPSVEAAFRAERFSIGPSAGLTGAMPGAPATKLPFAGRVLVADLLRSRDRHHAALLAAWALPTRAARDEAMRAAQAEALEAWNPLVKVLLIDLTRHAWGLEEARAWHVLARTAIAAERGRGEPGALPEDPLAPGEKLRHDRLGAAYRLWSRGPDGVDDGGEGDDLVLAREGR